MPERNKILATRRRAEFLVLRRRFEFDEFCGRCGAESRFVSLEDAMRLSGFSTREIVRRADAGEIHFLESRGGLLVVCQASLKSNAAKSFAEIELTEKHNLLNGETR
jgi:hypothetical protein